MTSEKNKALKEKELLEAQSEGNTSINIQRAILIVLQEILEELKK